MKDNEILPNKSWSFQFVIFVIVMTAQKALEPV
jgi:hypothetical protein